MRVYHIFDPRHAILPRVQSQPVITPSAVQGEHAVLHAPADPLPPEQILVWGKGALHEAAPSGEGGLSLYQKGHRDEKPQRGAALPAVQGGERSRLGDGVPQAVDPECSRPQVLHQSPQGRQAPAGGLDVL